MQYDMKSYQWSIYYRFLTRVCIAYNHKIYSTSNDNQICTILTTSEGDVDSSGVCDIVDKKHAQCYAHNVWRLYCLYSETAVCNDMRHITRYNATSRNVLHHHHQRHRYKYVCMYQIWSWYLYSFQSCKGSQNLEIGSHDPRPCPFWTLSVKKSI